MVEFPIPSVDRVEVIDETGHVFVRYNCEAKLDLQDNHRTLKIFLRQRTTNRDFVGGSL